MKTYKSKIDFGIILLFVISSAWPIYYCFSRKDGITASLLSLPVIFIFYLFYNTIYTVAKENLNIRFGFLVNNNIDIKTITQISETRSLVSSPAASIDRLEILHGKSGRILVSPKQKKDFIDSLLAINPDIVVKYRKKQ
ncbi:PH (Pleckstrin Homology) domain-containing protein [Flavobacterium sp. 90]|uniref:PH domain-containing protein n=1 Tax=unclassified Flavobacterium TaxID=196869 RepID=UPI000EB1F301|nr:MULTISPECIES: PH domain-containing protein [unclassified Flavobacterium]RKR05122.1 PH (Pleckstrin Homology) domain-containing protein [Flavobacterium sp. 81]TCK56437.1 PH (Pleckstrin Homology) domain-containing protein [Flavobacterium sp. 90]